MKKYNTNDEKKAAAVMYKLTHGDYPEWYTKLLNENGELPSQTISHEQMMRKLLEWRARAR